MNPEFSRLVRVDRIPVKGTEMTVTAEPAEREALARRFDVLSVESLTATVTLRPFRGGTMIRVSGLLVADVVQACVVTLEPVPDHVEEEIHVTFGPEQDEMLESGEIEIGFDDEEPPDPIIGGAIDIGEAIAEHLALALDPFPRKAGAEVPKGLNQPPPSEEKPNPFAKLAQLRQKKE